MISLNVRGSRLDLIPVVKGLVKETEKVLNAINDGGYDSYAVSWGKEEVEAVMKRNDIEDDPCITDLDAVYCEKLRRFGEIDLPDPSFTLLVDESVARGIPIVPLDMTDEEYTERFCNTVRTLDFIKEGRMARKAMNADFISSTPEEFVVEWDDLMNGIRGFRKISGQREEYIAESILSLAEEGKRSLILIEEERSKGILNRIGMYDDL